MKKNFLYNLIDSYKNKLTIIIIIIIGQGKQIFNPMTCFLHLTDAERLFCHLVIRLPSRGKPNKGFTKVNDNRSS